jgi:Flp pilus assembly CpaE family ATPase
MPAQMIDDLIDRCADKVGLTEAQARLGLSAALALIQKHADPAKVADLMAAIPGSAELAREGAAITENKPRGLVGGLMGRTGGAGGAAMADAMALNQRLSKEGIMLSDMQAILPIAMGFVHEKTGVDLLRDVLASIPGLGPLMTSG